MDSEIQEAFQKELTCLVCLNFLLDPVTIGCGHSFCRSCLCLFWEQAKAPASCPVCRQRSEQTNLKTNFLLKTLVSTVRKANLRQFLKCEEHLCGAHKQTKTIFCEADKSLLCLVCSQGQEHKTHKHCAAEKAAEESWELEDKLKWSESAQLHVPQPLLPELPARPMSGLMDWLNLFRVNFSFSNEVSSQHIRLFDDARHLTHEHDNPHAPSDGGTAKYFASWGDQSFTSGKQYWEMRMDSSWDWAVGVCKDSWIRKDDSILDESNRDNFLLVCVKQDDHYQLWTTAPATPLYIERPLERVGVFLDCDSGSISFVDAAKHSLLWRYDDGRCTFPVRPFICTGHRYYFNFQLIELHSLPLFHVRNMDSDTLQVFQSELTCSICMNCFLDPVTIDCGHSFCRPCLSLCWEEGQTPRSCPECRGLSEKPDFKTNIALKRLASLARQARADHDHSSEEQICVTHQEAKGLFCEADQTLLCGPCSECPEHAAHSHSLIPRAAEETRNYVALRKAMIKLEYQRMLLLLREEEQLHLEALDQEAKEICEQLKESVFRMTQQRESLKEMYRELTEMCHKPDVELLQGLENVLETNMSSKSLWNEVTCSLCVKYFIDPVTLDCGHSFCMPCLCLYWEEGQQPPRCPVCKGTPHQLSLKTNIILKTRVFLARRTGPYDVPRSAEKMCELHGKTKNLFCKVTKEVLCLVCHMSAEHGAHTHCSVEWTAEEYRSYVTMWKKNHTEYWKMFYLAYYGEKHRLEKIEEESREIFQQLKESQYNMDLKQKLLKQIYEELKELCYKPDMELIQSFICPGNANDQGPFLPYTRIAKLHGNVVLRKHVEKDALAGSVSCREILATRPDHESSWKI
ncbi:hypothetical protein MG293_019636 [Ovis ammon polii]|uniref:Tripartite motif-containing protein 43 n=1 Tax=Ovis ammon polii TaxID=230172 RepID=A0AAD4XXL1_OVIAM|nr:hypothetical protein MG293_019636 [Ovis ammon polii]